MKGHRKLVMAGIFGLLVINACTTEDELQRRMYQLSEYPVHFTTNPESKEGRSYLDFAEGVSGTGKNLKITPFWNKDDAVEIHSFAGGTTQSGVYKAVNEATAYTPLVYEGAESAAMKWIDNTTGSAVNQSFYSVFPANSPMHQFVQDQAGNLTPTVRITINAAQNGRLNGKDVSASASNPNFVAVGKQTASVQAAPISRLPKPVILDYKLVPTLIRLSIPNEYQQVIKSVTFADATTTKATAGIWEFDLTQAANTPSGLNLSGGHPIVTPAGDVVVKLDPPCAGEVLVDAYLLPHQYSNGLNITVQAGAGSQTKKTEAVSAHSVRQVRFGGLNNLIPEAKTFMANKVNFTMINIPGGMFSLGKTSEEVGLVDFDGGSCLNEDIHNCHAVRMSDFALGETEVTQGLWQAVMGDTGPVGEATKQGNAGANHPVYNVSWTDIVEGAGGEVGYTINNVKYKKDGFMYRLSVLVNGGKPLDSSSLKFCLPTEAQWEYAAKGQTGRRGITNENPLVPDYAYAGTTLELEEYAWYGANAWYGYTMLDPNYGTQEVKTKKPNQLGLFDMSGNVWEWCSDLYDEYPMPSVIPTDPIGPTVALYGNQRMAHGNSWLGHDRHCSLVFRNSYFVDTRNGVLGFRLALAAPF